ncbi:hypothetical protein AB8738_14430, partial [Salinicoccus roseus]
ALNFEALLFFICRKITKEVKEQVSQNLKIVLTPVADTSTKTVQQLNKDISTLQNKINPLNLKVSFDDKVLRTLERFSNAFKQSE